MHATLPSGLKPQVILIGPSSFFNGGEQVYDVDPFPQPLHHIDRHAVAERLVARPVGRPVPSPIRHVGVIVRKPLQTFAFPGRQAAHGPGCGDVGAR